MVRRGALRGVAVTVLLFTGVSLLAQTAETVPTPEPYSADEFPDWALSLRRAEIVATGVLPLTLLVSRVLYGLIRFTVASVRAGALNLDYAPWFFAPPGAPDLTRDEKLGVVAGAVALSTLVAWIDYLLLVGEEPTPP